MATHILEQQREAPHEKIISKLSNEQLHVTYEIQRTLAEIKKGCFTTVALQFPDSMLPDAPRVFRALSEGLNPKQKGFHQIHITSLSTRIDESKKKSDKLPLVRLYVLADTSYGACCVDEIAAEHVNAELVVHYGRSCLSPTARIPVIHVFTTQALPNRSKLIDDFESFYDDHETKVILMADVSYQSHLGGITAILQSKGYRNLHIAEIVRDTDSPLPNRSIPKEVELDASKLKEWQIFHVSHPPESLLLTLASRLAAIRIYPTSEVGENNLCEPFLASTSRALNRRYAIITSVSTVPILGILINTLSVKNYLHIVEHVKSLILAAGKKSYTFVVGKVNAAKVANFSEIGAWIVIGCWESSLLDSKDFWKPVLTPFELELALEEDGTRVWTGEWSGDFQKLLDDPKISKNKPATGNKPGNDQEDNGTEEGDHDFEPESAPPEFDLRTGQYVSHATPMRSPHASGIDTVPQKNSNSLTRQAKGDFAVVGGQKSPGAEYLETKRTWKGLGSDFEIAYDGGEAGIEQGRSGIARGYTHSQAEART